jgi:hypothetical protein
MSADTCVLLSPAVTAAHRDQLSAGFPDTRFVLVGDDGSVPPAGAEATVLLRIALSKPVLSSILRQVPTVGWVHTSTAGFDWALVPEIGERGIVLTRSAASYALPSGSSHSP